MTIVEQPENRTLKPAGIEAGAHSGELTQKPKLPDNVPVLQNGTIGQNLVSEEREGEGILHGQDITLTHLWDLDVRPAQLSASFPHQPSVETIVIFQDGVLENGNPLAVRDVTTKDWSLRFIPTDISLLFSGLPEAEVQRKKAQQSLRSILPINKKLTPEEAGEISQTVLDYSARRAVFFRYGAEGHPYLPQELSQNPHQISLLTARELEVVTLEAHGLTTAEIAKALDIKEETVRGHLKDARYSLHAFSPEEECTVAREIGYLSPPQRLPLAA